jgi:hypothetical protein
MALFFMTPPGLQVEDSEICPGSTGLLIDESPKLTTASIRPFVWAALLFRTGVKPSEIVGMVACVCNHEEGESRSWAELCAEEVLGDMLASGLCRYNAEKDLWVLSVGENRRNVPEVIAAVSSLNAELPKHFLLDMSKEQ